MAKTYEVTHNNLYLRVNAKMQKCEKGSHITLDAKTAEKLLARGRIAELGKKESVDVDQAAAAESGSAAKQ